MAETRQEPKGRDEGTVTKRARHFRASVVRWVVTVVNVVAAVFAVVLALHIVFVIFSANPHNPLVTYVAHWADGLVVFFRDLFTPADHRVAVLVNEGLAAIFWLIAGRIMVGLVRRIS